MKPTVQLVLGLSAGCPATLAGICAGLNLWVATLFFAVLAAVPAAFALYLTRDRAEWQP